MTSQRLAACGIALSVLALAGCPTEDEPAFDPILHGDRLNIWVEFVGDDEAPVDPATEEIRALFADLDVLKD